MKLLSSRWLPVFLWAAVIFISSANLDPYKVLPTRLVEPCFSTEANSPSCAELLGRVLHTGKYAILAVLISRALIWHRNLRFSNLLIVLGLVELYALSDETIQLFVPGRTFQLLDLALDLLGGGVGLMLYTLFRKYLQQKS
ncbi:MAG: VanZ family protein [Chloroflexi bacterium]|nr:VanZ family protein [Chloroflexota bacterium]